MLLLQAEPRFQVRMRRRRGLSLQSRNARLGCCSQDRLRGVGFFAAREHGRAGGAICLVVVVVGHQRSARSRGLGAFASPPVRERGQPARELAAPRHPPPAQHRRGRVRSPGRVRLGRGCNRQRRGVFLLLRLGYLLGARFGRLARGGLACTVLLLGLLPQPVGVFSLGVLELGRRGKTVVLSSHLLPDVEDVVDRMVILYGGKVRGEGTCDELLASNSKTSIETDTLDDETIDAIDRLIRERTGGEKSIRSVARPRQKLEEYFLGIVEQARAERLETSGAVASGATAAFLMGDEKSGDALISRLLEDAPLEPAETGHSTPPAHTPVAHGAQGHRGDDSGDDVIDSLLADDSRDTPMPTPPKPSRDGNSPKGGGGGTASDDDVDLGVIGSLLEPEPRDGADPENDRPSGEKPR